MERNETDGSRTLTEEKKQEIETYPMRLNPRPHVSFEEGVIDNEHLNRKKSKKCCIFHKQRSFGESSSESSEDEHSSKKHKHSSNCSHGKVKFKVETKTKAKEKEKAKENERV